MNNKNQNEILETIADIRVRLFNLEKDVRQSNLQNRGS